MSEIQSGLDRVLERASNRIKSAMQGQAGARMVSGISLSDVPRTVRDGLGIPETDRIFATSIKPGDFRGVVGRIVARVKRTQEAAGAVLRNLTGIGLTDEERELLAVDRELGGKRLLEELVQAAEEALFKPSGTVLETVRGEAVDARMPTQKIRDALASMAGEAAQSGVQRLLSGNQGAGMVANGERVMELAARRGVRTLVFTWVYGNPAARQSNFEPHMNINGIQWENPDDPVLSTDGTGAEWIGPYFRPGDHKGCMCVASRTVVVRPPGAGVQTEPPFEIPSPPTICPDHRGLTAGAHVLVATAACRTSVPTRVIEGEIEYNDFDEYRKHSRAMRDVDWERSLTEDELLALKMYAHTGDYVGINHVLRENPTLGLMRLPGSANRPLREALEQFQAKHGVGDLTVGEMADTVHHTQEALRRTRLARAERTVYRSVRRDDMDWITKLDEGEMVVFDGFTSTVTNPTALRQIEKTLGYSWNDANPIVLEMRTRSGAFLDEVIDSADPEFEWLLPHHTNWYVESIEEAVEIAVPGPNGDTVTRTVVRLVEFDPATA